MKSMRLAALALLAGSGATTAGTVSVTIALPAGAMDPYTSWTGYRRTFRLDTDADSNGGLGDNGTGTVDFVAWPTDVRIYRSLFRATGTATAGTGNDA